MADVPYQPGQLLPSSSVVQGIFWPAFTQGEGQALLALLAQLVHTERMPDDQRVERQLVQVSSVIRHAREHTRHYARAFRGLPAGPLDLATFRQLPLLPRKTLRDRPGRLYAAQVPKSHGDIGELRTSGSTGMPIVVRATSAYRVYWQAFSLRDELWHRRDVTKPRVAIRMMPPGVADYPAGAIVDMRGSPLQALGPVGPMHNLQLSTPVHQQLEFLQRVRPSHLITQPSNLHALAAEADRQGVDLPLATVLCISEVLRPDTRALVRRVFGARVSNTYSAQELGYIAIQCPDHDHLHVQSESALVEVLREDGTPCQVGEVGRVVVTQLHNLATPLVRYEVGDYAEVGPPCTCGRTLPVLTSVAGRVRNMMKLPHGALMVPRFGSGKLMERIPLVQHQFVQTHLDRVEARFVVARPLDDTERAFVVEHLASRLGRHLTIEVVEVQGLARGAGGKFEDFICEVDSEA